MDILDILEYKIKKEDLNDICSIYHNSGRKRKDDELIKYSNNYISDSYSKFIEIPNEYKLNIYEKPYNPIQPITNEYFNFVDYSKTKTPLKIENKNYSLEDLIIGNMELYSTKYISDKYVKKKIIIDETLLDEKIDVIISKMRHGVPLSEEERRHVKTIEDFYREHEMMFLKRSEQTADKRQELRYIKTILRTMIPKNGKVLDLGCGVGRLTLPLLEDKFNVFGMDLTPELIAAARNNSPVFADRFKQGNIFNIPYETRSFSAVLMMWHVISDISFKLGDALKEINKVLERGGILVFDIPDIGSDGLSQYYDGEDGENNYSAFLAKIPEMVYLKTELKKAGFEIIREKIKPFRWGIHKFVIICKKVEDFLGLDIHLLEKKDPFYSSKYLRN